MIECLLTNNAQIKRRIKIPNVAELSAVTTISTKKR